MTPAEGPRDVLTAPIGFGGLASIELGFDWGVES